MQSDLALDTPVLLSVISVNENPSRTIIWILLVKFGNPRPHGYVQEDFQIFLDESPRWGQI